MLLKNTPTSKTKLYDLIKLKTEKCIISFCYKQYLKPSVYPYDTAVMSRIVFCVSFYLDTFYFQFRSIRNPFLDKRSEVPNEIDLSDFKTKCDRPWYRNKKGPININHPQKKLIGQWIHWINRESRSKKKEGQMIRMRWWPDGLW